MTDVYGREKTNAEWLTDQAKALRERANPCAGETPITIMAGRFEGAAAEIVRLRGALSGLVDALAANDEDGLTEFAEPMTKARAALREAGT